jgi:hypothetical protein
MRERESEKGEREMREREKEGGGRENVRWKPPWLASA